MSALFKLAPPSRGFNVSGAEGPIQGWRKAIRVGDAELNDLLKPLHFLSRQGLWAVVDVTLIDGAVNWVGRTAKNLGTQYGRWVQTGQIQTYALAITGGAVAILYWLMAA